MAHQSAPQLREFVIRGQKVELLRYLEANPAAVNDQDQDGVSLLMEAAANNHINILVILLEYKAEPNCVNQIGRSALMEASCRGHPAIALRLCQVPRIDFNRQNEKHSLRLTSLMEAASRGHTGVVFWLCEAKADINARNTWNDTALTLAAHNNRYECVRTLVAQGAEIDICGDGGLTALQIAANRGYGRIVEFLSNPDIRSPLYLTQLCSSIKSQQKAVLQDEVNYDASVLSRTFGPLPSYSILPSFTESVIPVWIPPNRGYSFNTSTNRHEKTSSNLPNYSTPPFRFSTTLHKPRLVPFSILPRFGSCSWVAIVPRRHEKKTHQVSMDEYQLSISQHNFPLLTLYDDGRWTYDNDIVSGELSGTFTIYQVITHGTLNHITNIPQNPLELVSKFEHDFTDRLLQQQSQRMQNGGGGTHQLDDNNNILQDFTSQCTDFLETLPHFEPKYNPIQHQPIYYVRLSTGGNELNGSMQVLQTVEFYLGKEIALGQLVMLMAEDAAPWWVYEDSAADADDFAAQQHYLNGGEGFYQPSNDTPQLQQNTSSPHTSHSPNDTNNANNNHNDQSDIHQTKSDNLSVDRSTFYQDSTTHQQSQQQSPHSQQFQ